MFSCWFDSSKMLLFKKKERIDLLSSVKLLLSIFRLGFVTSYLSEPFVSGFTTGAAIHVFRSQLPSLFGVRSPSKLATLFKLPRFVIKLIELIFTEINWMTTSLSCMSIVFLIVVKYLNDRYKAKVRIVLPTELVLVSFDWIFFL